MKTKDYTIPRWPDKVFLPSEFWRKNAWRKPWDKLEVFLLFLTEASYLYILKQVKFIWSINSTCPAVVVGMNDNVYTYVYLHHWKLHVHIYLNAIVINSSGATIILYWLPFNTNGNLHLLIPSLHLLNTALLKKCSVRFDAILLKFSPSLTDFSITEW